MADFEIVHAPVLDEQHEHHEHTHPHRNPPTHDDIAVRAYYIWLAETTAPDYSAADGEAWAVNNWMTAEQELTDECGSTQVDDEQ